jgi:uroporphyrinogen III methyltransferase/synthase
MKSIGAVYLVGAGPGDPGLLTLRGAELLARADVVVYDALVNADLLRHARVDAQIIFGGKRAGGQCISQPELNRLLIQHAREGKTVVRLKGGDPYVFGRGAEEAAELADAKIPFEVVPGISSFVAVPGYAGIPLTHRNHASRITLVTGHEEPSKEAAKINWEQVAKAPGTKVIMMGTERIGEIAKTLISHGMSSDTAIALVRWGTTGRQQTVAGTLANIQQRMESEKLGPPTVAVIGEVVELREKLNWFEKRPLFNQRIVVTRSREQSPEFVRRLHELGADVLEIPTIKIEPTTYRDSLVDALLELNSYDWLVFTSANGVTAFFDLFFRRFHDMRDIGGARIAAVGPATANRLKELHLQVDLMPEDATGAHIAEAFAEFESVENLKICLLRAEIANAELPEALEALGAIVDDIALYRTVPETEDVNGAVNRLMEQGADWITFTSSSTVENFNSRLNLKSLIEKLPELRILSIGPETSKALAALDVDNIIEARVHTIDGMIEALLKRREKPNKTAVEAVR